VASSATGVNDLGVVIGTSTDTDGRVHGFVRAGDQLQEVDHAFAARSLVPLAVDNAGTIVGEYTPPSGGETRAFASGAEGWAEDLGDRLPSGSGWNLITARGVNELGQVVGFGTKDGRYDGFVLGAAHAPLTEDQAVSTKKDTGLSIDLVGFDPDVADPVAYEVLDEPQHGSLGAIVDGRLDYSPDAGYEGTDRFTWRLSDPEYGSVPATVTIAVGDAPPDRPPTIEVAAPQNGDEGSAIALHATAADPDGTELVTIWSATAGVLSGSGDDVTLTLPDGPDQISVTASTTDGTTSVSATAQIDVRNAPPTVEAGGDLTVDQGVALTLTGAAGDPSAQDAAALDTHWDFGDGSSGSGTTVSHTWAAAGIYPVTLTATDPDGARSTDHLRVTVEEAPAGGPAGATPVVARIRVKPKVPGADRKVRFVGKQSTGHGPLTYAWNFHNGGAKVDATGIKVKTFYRRLGEHSITLVVTDSTGASDKVAQRFWVRRHYANRNAAPMVRPGMFKGMISLF
jgi:probable HAF family extracellular repeat protein